MHLSLEVFFSNVRDAKSFFFFFKQTKVFFFNTKTLLLIHALPWTLLMQQCFVIALDKDRADRFTAPLCSLFWFSKARWFNKSVPFDSQGLNPPGEETKTRPKKKEKCSNFFFFGTAFFFWLPHPAGSEEDRFRPAAPTTLTATSSLTATAAPSPPLQLLAVLAAFFLSVSPV